MSPPAERRHVGLPAAPGVAIGPLVRLVAAPPLGAAGGPAGAEASRLTAAIARAQDELAALMAAQGDLGVDILAVQVELLEDAELTRPAFAAIEAGRSARSAWLDAMKAQIALFESDADELFRARAADLADLRDRVLAALDGAGAAPSLPPGALLLDHDLTPSRFLALDREALRGIALEAGSAASHVALLARARGVPLVTGLGPVAGGEVAVLDGAAGELIVAPAPATLARFRPTGRHARPAPPIGPAVTRDGERVEVMVNVDDPTALDDEILAAADGVGLLRTEFLFLGRDRLPDEDEQLAALTGLLDRLGGKPCIARLLDIGGDKPLPGLMPVAEANPFLGLRGVRLLLERPLLLRPQVRAMLRAAAGRPLRVMLPMVTVAGELAAVREVFAGCLNELRRDGVRAEQPPLGIMVETPAAALALELLDADFFSIGTNDLTQYVMAAARDAGGSVAKLLDPLHPAVLRLIAGVVRQAELAGRPVSLCGDLASDPHATGRLLALGLRRLSAAPLALAAVKRAVGDYAGQTMAGETR